MTCVFLPYTFIFFLIFPSVIIFLFFNYCYYFFCMSIWIEFHSYWFSRTSNWCLMWFLGVERNWKEMCTNNIEHCFFYFLLDVIIWIFLFKCSFFRNDWMICICCFFQLGKLLFTLIRVVPRYELAERLTGWSVLKTLLVVSNSCS
jgi:hypothetical protein